VGQGYLFSKPLHTTAEAIAYLRSTDRNGARTLAALAVDR
jgi:hypothetical protein